MPKNTKYMKQKLKYKLVLNQAYYLQETKISERQLNCTYFLEEQIKPPWFREGEYFLFWQLCFLISNFPWHYHQIVDRNVVL